MGLRAFARNLLIALPVLYLSAFFFYPLARIFYVSFAAAGENGIGATLPQSAFWRVLGFTFWQATLSTLLTVIFGLPLAYMFARYEFRGKSRCAP